MKLTTPQIAAVARSAGFDGEALVMAVAIALRESGGDPGIVGDIDNPKRGCRSYGLMQINVCPGGHVPGGNRGVPWRENPQTLLDPATNMRAAWEMSSGGRNFGPWSTYRAGIPAPDIERVRRELAGVDLSSAQPDASGIRIPGTGVDVPNPLEPLGKLGELAALLTDGNTWRRVLMVLVGGTLVVAGWVIVKRDAVTDALDVVSGGITDEVGITEAEAGGSENEPATEGSPDVPT